MQLKSWSRKQFKKLAKQNAAKLVEHSCFFYVDSLDIGEEHYYLFSKSGVVLMKILFHMAYEEPLIQVAPSKYWKEGVRENQWDTDPFFYWAPIGKKGGNRR